MIQYIKKLLLSLTILSLPIIVSGQYRFDVWTAENGLPQNSVNGILQSRDGFIWLTTLDGIVRFDGISFKVFNKSNTEGLLSSRFHNLLEDKNGRIWFTNEAGGLVLYKDGVFKSFTEENGLPAKKLSWLFHDGKGGFLTKGEKGFFRYEDGKFITVKIKSSKPNSIIRYVDKKGGIWLVDDLGLRRVIGDDVTYFDIKETEENSFFTRIFEDSQKSVWIGQPGERLRRIYQNKIQEFSINIDSFPSFAEDVKGNVLVGYSNKLVNISKKAVSSEEVLSEEIQIIDKNNGFPGSEITRIFGDREGSVWIGSRTDGLIQAIPQDVKVFSNQNWNSPDENIYPTFEDSQGKVWLGAWQNTLVKFENGEFQTVANREETKLIVSLFEDSEKNLWVSSQKGIYTFKNGNFTKMDELLGFDMPGDIFTINQDRNKNMWFGKDRVGLIRYKDGKVKLFSTEDGLPSNRVTAFWELKDGRILIGTRNGIAIYQNGKWMPLSEKGDLKGNYVRSLYEDKKGVVWVGTYDNGLFRYKDGKFTNIKVKDGLYSKNVFCILEDENGWFWMNSNIGIYRVQRQQLEEFTTGKINKITSIAYTKKDGLLNAEGNGGTQPSGIRRKNGELWFPTQKGVAVVKPWKITINTNPPPVHFDEVLIDGGDIGRYKDKITLKPEQQSLEINYTGLSFINPELVKFRYRLEGFDENWNEIGTRRFAYYNYLPPGEYTFQLQAANRDGIWNTKGKSLKITVEPLYYETWWFMILIALTVVTGLLLIYLYRISNLKKIALARSNFAEQLIESQEAERKRIAGELHDGLGQSLVIIKNRAILGAEEKDFEEYGEISNTATNALDEVREIIYNLSPQYLERIGLTAAMQEMLERTGGIIELEEDIDSIDDLFSADIEINVYRIVQECVNNTIKHSEATKAKITIKSKQNRILIKAEDNGKGFNVENVREKQSSFGLIGLKERVRLLKGKVEIHSKIDSGTKIVIELPFYRL